MNAGVTSERVYDALKARLLGGGIRPGERLEPGVFAELLTSSVTPVRDALHRLAGEHIVEMRTAEGFQLPLVTEPGLRDLVLWNGDLLRLALRRWPEGRTSQEDIPTTGDYARDLRALFGAIAGRSGQSELARQIDAASDRLTPARIAESRVVSDSDRELAAIADAIASGEARRVAQHIAAYHRHRAAIISAIVEAMYRGR
ncbi:MAG: GntR family transcriptional regulator [Sphingopyxis sp.]|nr:GntR family transcriptional regulator [Sphingopyxis sp.]